MDDQGSYAYRPEGTLSEGLRTPTGLTADPETGVLYVTRYATHSVVGHRKGAGKSEVDHAPTVREGIHGPWDACIAPNGTLRVASFNDQTLVGYREGPGGRFVPDRRIDIPGLNQPVGIAADGDSTIYVTNPGANDVGVYRKGADGSHAADPDAAISRGLNGRNQLLFRGNDQLLVADLNTSAVAVYGRRKDGALAREEDRCVIDGIRSVASVAFSPDGTTLYALDCAGNTITVYEEKKVTLSPEERRALPERLFPKIPHAKATGTIDPKIPAHVPDKTKTVSRGIQDPRHTAFDRNGRLYVVNMTCNNVNVFRKNASCVHVNDPAPTLPGMGSPGPFPGPKQTLRRAREGPPKVLHRENRKPRRPGPPVCDRSSPGTVEGGRIPARGRSHDSSDPPEDASRQRRRLSRFTAIPMASAVRWRGAPRSTSRVSVAGNSLSPSQRM